MLGAIAGPASLDMFSTNNNLYSLSYMVVHVPPIPLLISSYYILYLTV